MSIQSRSHQYGTVFENWQILELLGQGSGGKTAVFRLKRIDSNRGQSALKVVNLIEERGDYDNMPAFLKKEYEGARDECKDSALQEVYMMADFQGNTNIVDYLDHKFVDWTDESGFGCDMLIRMELLKDLRSELRGGKTFTEEEIIKLGCDICQALILCHGNDILHRDIKPENIFINRNGNYKLGDFGISRIISNAPMSMASTGIGTPEYAAPEQTSGKYDKRVDIYSLGLVLYELSNQQHLPFARSTYVRPDDVNKRMAGVPIPAPAKASKELSAVILKACAFKPENRYQTVQEFADALCALTTNPTGFRPAAQVAVGSNSISSATPQGGLYSTEPAIPTGHYATAPAIGDGKASSTGGYQTAPATPKESIRTAPSQPKRETKPKAQSGAKIQKQDPAPGDDFLMYKETIRKAVSGHGKIKNSEEYAVVDIRFEPTDEDGFTFDIQVTDNSIPDQYFAAITKGLVEGLDAGPFAGCTVDRIKAVLTGGSYHPVFSSEKAFEKAARLAFTNSYNDGAPVLLEAVVEIKADILDDSMAVLFGKINAQRGRIMNMDFIEKSNCSQVTFEIPIGGKDEIVTYIKQDPKNEIHSIRFARYAQVTGATATAIIDAIKAKKSPLTQASQAKADTNKPGVVVATNPAPKAVANTTSTPSASTPKARGLFKGIKSRLSVKVKSNEPPSIEQLIKLAQQDGSGKAKFDVGMAYYEGKICLRNYEQAVLWFTEAVNANYPPAGTALGNCYYHGHGTTKNLAKAVRNYSMARYGGDAEGAFLLGQCYENGHGVAVNYKTAAECYAEAAEKGHLLAMRQLAFCYESSGRGVKHDAKLAFTWYQKAAEAGDTKSMMKMADYCWYGQYAKQDLEKSREWSERAVELGDVEAMCKLARKAKPLFSFSREHGYSVYEVEEECKESVRLYRMAAERDCEEAKEALEEIYEDLIAEQNQSDANYRAMATRLLKELWPNKNG